MLCSDCLEIDQSSLRLQLRSMTCVLHAPESVGKRSRRTSTRIRGGTTIFRVPIVVRGDGTWKKKKGVRHRPYPPSRSSTTLSSVWWTSKQDNPGCCTTVVSWAMAWTSKIHSSTFGAGADRWWQSPEPVPSRRLSSNKSILGHCSDVLPSLKRERERDTLKNLGRYR